MNINAPSERFINLPFLGKQRIEAAGTQYNPEKGHKELRLPFIGFLPNRLRNHAIAMMGEFVGTFLFIFFAFAATQVANASAAAENTNGQGGNQGADGGLSQAPNASTLLYISLAFGFSLAVNAWVFFRITGGLFNPAVTLAMALIGAVPWGRAGLIFVAQILGAIAASGVVLCLYPGAMNVATTLGGNTSVTQGVFIEMFLTAMLVFTILMLAAEKHKGTFLAPVGIGLSLFVCELAGVFFTGGSLNPARSFGPAVALRTFPGYHWIYWVGPILGSLLAVGFYRFIKVLEYETANPGQDFNEKEAEAFTFDEDTAATVADVSRPAAPIQPSYDLSEGSQRAASPLSSNGQGSQLSKTRSMPAAVAGAEPNSPNRMLSPPPVPGVLNKPATTPAHLDKVGETYRNAPSAEAGDVQHAGPTGNDRVSAGSTLGDFR